MKEKRRRRREDNVEVEGRRRRMSEGIMERESEAQSVGSVRRRRNA